MSLKVGIVGLPNVGKSTLFNAITNSQVEAANYPFATINPNVGVVELPDARLKTLASMVKPEKVISAVFEFIDIAGLVKGASNGEGLGNKFLANIRETDAIIQVVRCFEDENITHVSGSVNPIRDMQIINLELILDDLDTVLNVIKRTERLVKNTDDKFSRAEFAICHRLKKAFEEETPARLIILTDDERKIVKGYNLLTMKPLLYVGNVSENFVAKPNDAKLLQIMKDEAKTQEAGLIGISVAIENELSRLEDEEKEMFLKELDIEYSGLDRLIRASFELLNLSTYFTAGVKEVRAWIFKNGSTAPQCAGIIHTDFEKGFIKAEVISYKDYVSNGGEAGSREAGKTKIEGKNYIMVDGDIVHFRFNV